MAHSHRSYHDGVLTKRQRQKILKRFGVEELHCQKCGRSVRLGSRYRLKYPPDPHDGRKRDPHLVFPGRIYHQACFESLYLDP